MSAKADDNDLTGQRIITKTSRTGTVSSFVIANGTPFSGHTGPNDPFVPGDTANAITAGTGL